MTEKEWLGENNQLGIDIYEKKYRHRNETFDEFLHRISGGDDDLRQLIVDKKFLPAGRILANRGTNKDGRKITLSNCYVSTPPEDNLESIFQCASNMARTYSYGGGVGVDISKLSPRGAKINNTAKETSGAVSFMDLYSMTTGLIGQNGRRGALMISLDCSHPDIEEFIDIKTDLSRVTKANISIRVTDEFMNAVKNDLPYDLTFTRETTGETISKTVSARKLFRKMAEANWDYAEPAALFWDRIKTWSLLSNTEGFEYAGVNPCFTGDMKLLTPDGYKTFNELSGKDVEVVNINGISTKGKVWNSGNKEIIKLVFCDGSEIKCTPNHIFMTIDGDECKAEDSKGVKLMPFTSSCKTFDKQFIKYGFIQGDGQLSRLSSEYHDGIEVNIGHKDGDVLDLFSDEKYSVAKDNRHVYVSGYSDKLREYGFSGETMLNRVFPSTYNSWSKNEKASFLQGCYSANGTVLRSDKSGSCRVGYKTICKEFAQQLVLTLKNDFDIDSYITTNKPTVVSFKNGDYLCRQSYDINIGRYQEIVKFFTEINFYQQYKKLRLSNLLIKKSPKVRNIEKCGIEPVYDFYEPNTHWGVVNGIIAHNCAEETLPAGGSCLLGSLNLSEFVDKNDNRLFDIFSFEKAIRICVRALNDILDEGLPLHPLQEQKDSVNNWRQIGLGIMGLSDMLIKNGLKYGDKESLAQCSKIGSLLINTSFDESINLAKERGAFPKYNYDNIVNSDFFKFNIKNKDAVKAKLKKYGLCNSQILTIPPCGTIATMIGVSSGIEPIFANYYERKTESLHGKDMSYKVYTPIVEDT